MSLGVHSSFGHVLVMLNPSTKIIITDNQTSACWKILLASLDAFPTKKPSSSRGFPSSMLEYRRVQHDHPMQKSSPIFFYKWKNNHNQKNTKQILVVNYQELTMTW